MSERRWMWRLVPVGLLGVLAVAYVLVRPGLAARNPYLTIWEFPLGAILVATLLWLALRRAHPQAPPIPWRRHAQVVRPLPDPAVAPYVEILDRWVQTGEAPERAADVLARALTRDPSQRGAAAAQIASELKTKTTRRSRGSHLKHLET